MIRFDFEKLKGDIQEAVKIFLKQFAKKHPKEKVCAFSLCSDEGALTLSPALNIKSHQEEKHSENTDEKYHYAFIPSEWAYESEGEHPAFQKISTRLVRILWDHSTGGEAHFDEFSEFRALYYETCIKALEELKKEGYFKDQFGEDILLLFWLTDADLRDVYLNETKMIARLNNQNTVMDYFKMLKYNAQVLVGESIEDIQFSVGASQEHIDAVQKESEVTFPQSYQWFLLNYGAAEVYLASLYGIEWKTRASVLKNTLDFRAQGMEKNLVAIGADDNYAYYLDTDDTTFDECGVVVCDTEGNWTDIEYGNYYEFLIQLLLQEDEHVEEEDDFHQDGEDDDD